jgi:hypothetical protein
MQSMMITIQAQMKEEHAAETEAVVQRVIAALERDQPAGVRYASLRLADGVTYLALVELEDADDNPLLSLPEYQELVAKLPEWHAAPPQAGPATVVGSYRLLADAVTAG